MKCPHCDVSLTLHRDEKLRCHYCGYTMKCQMFALVVKVRISVVVDMERRRLKMKSVISSQRLVLREWILIQLAPRNGLWTFD